MCQWSKGLKTNRASAHGPHSLPQDVAAGVGFENLVAQLVSLQFELAVQLPERRSLDPVAFAAPAALVAGTAYDAVQEATVGDEFTRQDVFFRDL